MQKQGIKREIAKFVVVGFINTGLDYGLLRLLLWLTPASLIDSSWKAAVLFVINSISYGTAVVNSYFLNKYWTFLDRSKKNELLKFSGFVLLNLLSLILNSTIVSLVTTYISPVWQLSPTEWLTAAKLLIATPAVMCFNYFTYKFLVFRK